MAALIRRSPANRTTVSPYGVSGSATLSKSVSNPYYTGSPQQQVSLTNYANKYNIAARLAPGATQQQVLTAAQANLNQRTAYLQPTSQDLAKGNFGQFGPDITPEEYKSQRTSLSAVQSIGKALGIQTAATGPVGVSFVNGYRQITNTPEIYAKFQQDIELEEMFGMLGSGSAGNIRLAAALTGAPIPKLIAAENKVLGIRQTKLIGKPAFQYQRKLYDVEGNLVGGVEGFKVQGSVDLSKEAAPVAQALKPSGGTDNLTSAFGVQVGETFRTPTLNAPLPKVSTPVAPKTTSGTIQTTVVALPEGNAGAQYRADFVKATGVDIFKPLIAPKEVRAIKDITGISQGKAPTLFYPDFLGKLTAPGELKGGKFEGVRYADLYEPKSPGSTTLKLTSAGEAFRALQIKGTPMINVRINNNRTYEPGTGKPKLW